MERLLQINMATLAVLGALALGMGQGNPALPMLMIAAAGLSLWLTDARGYVRLNRTLANLVALVVAVIVLMRELTQLGSQAQILGVAQLLVYLQIVLMFQRKQQREYWQIGMLSLLEVVAAAAFMQGFWFGAVLIVYMAVGLSGLVLLCLFDQWRPFRATQRPSRATSRRPQSTPLPQARRWPLAGASAGFAPVAVGSERVGLGRELVGWLAWTSVAALVFTAIVFFTLPRLGESAWRGARSSVESIVGFTPEVTLGELGQVIEDPSEVMRVSFRHHANGEPHDVVGPIYLHGTLLATYQNGRWQALPRWRGEGARPMERIGLRLPDDLVRQQIVIEPLRQPELFYAAPLVSVQTNYDVFIDHARQRLFRSEQFCHHRFKYMVGTTAIVDGRQRGLVPLGTRHGWERYSTLVPDQPDALPRLRALAEQWLDESDLPADDVHGRARYLEGQLAFSGDFSYSLTGQNRDPAIDPIEDFVSNNRAGHCEYFATALALMLRSQGIPSRVVVGYKTNEYDEVGHHYQVRQLHAHTWVEAFLPRDQIPDHLLHGEGFWPWRHGGWLRLDPTPAARDAVAGFDAQWWSPAARARLWLDSVWSDYVLDMDRPRQKEAVYAPLAETLTLFWRGLTDPHFWRDWLAAWKNLASWPRWQAGLVVAVGLLVIALLGRLLIPLAARAWLALTARLNRRRHANAVSVAFYARLERALARAGLRRAQGQTPRELAAAAAHWMSPHGGLDASLRAAADPSRRAAADVALLPGRVVDAFYQVRFGGQSLDANQTDEINRALTRLEESIAAGRLHHPTNDGRPHG